VGQGQGLLGGTKEAQGGCILWTARRAGMVSADQRSAVRAGQVPLPLQRRELCWVTHRTAARQGRGGGWQRRERGRGWV